GPGYIITNVARSGGRVLPTKTAFARADLPYGSSNGLSSQINEISVIAAKHLQRHYKHIRTVGLDVAVDKYGKVWIIEANFTPSISLFRKLRNRSMYKRIC